MSASTQSNAVVFPVDYAPAPDERWLDHHHLVTGTFNGDEVDVFAIEYGNVYGEPDAKKTWEISFNLGPVTITVVIVVEGVTADITVYAKLPFLPPVEIAHGSGSLADGISFTIDLPFIKGTLKFYLKDGWVWLHYDVTVLGKKYEDDIKLFQFPFDEK